MKVFAISGKVSLSASTVFADNILCLKCVFNNRKGNSLIHWLYL